MRALRIVKTAQLVDRTPPFGAVAMGSFCAAATSSVPGIHVGVDGRGKREWVTD